MQASAGCFALLTLLQDRLVACQGESEMPSTASKAADIGHVQYRIVRIKLLIERLQISSSSAPTEADKRSGIVKDCVSTAW